MFDEGEIKKKSKSKSISINTTINNDSIKDDITRHNFVLSEIERICLLSEKDKHKLYLESIPTIKYNQNIFMNFDIKGLISNMFNQIVS